MSAELFKKGLKTLSHMSTMMSVILEARKKRETSSIEWENKTGVKIINRSKKGSMLLVYMTPFHTCI